MTTIALFSGQGSQYEKMGLDLVKQDAELESIYEAASEALGFDLFAIVADADAQTLGRTIYAQPAIMATSLVCLEAAKKHGFTYDAVAGHSLGEYAAMVAAGMLSLEDGFKVIKARSEAMDAAAAAADAGHAQWDPHTAAGKRRQRLRSTKNCARLQICLCIPQRHSSGTGRYRS